MRVTVAVRVTVAMRVEVAPLVQQEAHSEKESDRDSYGLVHRASNSIDSNHVARRVNLKTGAKTEPLNTLRYSLTLS